MTVYDIALQLFICSAIFNGLEENNLVFALLLISTAPKGPLNFTHYKFDSRLLFKSSWAEISIFLANIIEVHLYEAFHIHPAGKESQPELFFHKTHLILMEHQDHAMISLSFMHHLYHTYWLLLNITTYFIICRATLGMTEKRIAIKYDTAGRKEKSYISAFCK